MKNAFLSLLVLLCGGFVSSFAQAQWAPVVACDGRNMVVDHMQQEGNVYQLVIRDQNIISYFSSKANLSRNINEKGELIVPMILTADETRPGSPAYYTGAVSVGQIEVTTLSPGVFRVAVVEYGYHASYRKELADWVFRNCGAALNSHFAQDANQR